MRKSLIMESSSFRGEEGWTNGPILQTIAAHLTKMKHWTRLNKDAPVAWYSYTYKFFAWHIHIVNLIINKFLGSKS